MAGQGAGQGGRLVAFYAGRGPLGDGSLRGRLGESPPAYMVPSDFPPAVLDAAER